MKNKKKFQKKIKKMVPSTVWIKLFNSNAIEVMGEAICAVTYDSTSVPVTWHIINGLCEPILAGAAALQLCEIKFNHKPGMYCPVRMI